MREDSASVRVSDNLARCGFSEENSAAAVCLRRDNGETRASTKRETIKREWAFVRERAVRKWKQEDDNYSVSCTYARGVHHPSARRSFVINSNTNSRASMHCFEQTHATLTWNAEANARADDCLSRNRRRRAVFMIIGLNSGAKFALFAPLF